MLLLLLFSLFKSKQKTNIDFAIHEQNFCLQCWRPGFDPRVRKIPWKRKWQPLPTQVLLPGECHGWRSLLGYSQWDRESCTRLSNFTFFGHTYQAQLYGLCVWVMTIKMSSIKKVCKMLGCMVPQGSTDINILCFFLPNPK